MTIEEIREKAKDPEVVERGRKALAELSAFYMQRAKEWSDRIDAEMIARLRKRLEKVA